jgi:AcrR family transcriptional regulator
LARPEPPRRTQEERRKGTIAKLLDAAAAALIEDGYAAASVQNVCSRAALSQGALFRHFATREALMVAVGEDVGREMLTRYRRDFETLRHEGEPLTLALRLVRRRCRSRLNQAYYELIVAARTSTALRRGLRPVAERYHREIAALAAELLPAVAAAAGEGFPALVATVVAAFDGEALHRFVTSDAAIDEQRLEILGALVHRRIARSASSKRGAGKVRS